MIPRNEIVSCEIGTDAETVSYTHLDVYKRQTLYSVIIWFLSMRELSNLKRIVLSDITSVVLAG